MKRLSSAETCAIGHPDKVCDQISDAILDAFLAKDPQARVDCTALISHKTLLISGEITSTAEIDVEQIAKKTIQEIGYDPALFTTTVELATQSEDIKDAILSTGRLGAGDQGIMVGYATNETKEYMPLAIIAGRKIMQQLAKRRPELGPDGKCLVGVVYDGFTPQYIDFIVISTQHHEKISLNDVRDQVRALIAQEYISSNTKLLINPAGRFVLGGPFADTGLTGRKIIADCYGDAAHHGGGAFSGKDPTKVDRSSAYMARYIAKNIVAAQLAKRVEVTLHYVIGQEAPLHMGIDCFGTEVVPIDQIVKNVLANFDLTVGGIISHLHLARPIYAQCAWLGHFGRDDPTCTWEATNKIQQLK